MSGLVLFTCHEIRRVVSGSNEGLYKPGGVVGWAKLLQMCRNPELISEVFGRSVIKACQPHQMVLVSNGRRFNASLMNLAFTLASANR